MGKSREGGGSLSSWHKRNIFILFLKDQTSSDRFVQMRCSEANLHRIFTLVEKLRGSWEFDSPVYKCFADMEEAHDCVP